MKVGNPNEDDTLVGPMITKAQYETTLDYIKIATDDGCNILSGGKKMEMTNSLTEGYWIEPTVVSNVKANMRVATEEIFGPILSIISFEDEAEAVEISNSVVYGLSGSVWTKDSSKALRMIEKLNTGIIWVNNMLDGYPQIPVPPHKMSGTGVELGIEGMMTYCKQKSAVMGYDDKTPVGWNL